MRPHQTSLRIETLNNILKDLGASSKLGAYNSNDCVEYGYSDGTRLVFSPLDDIEGLDDD